MDTFRIFETIGKKIYALVLWQRSAADYTLPNSAAAHPTAQRSRAIPDGVAGTKLSSVMQPKTTTAHPWAPTSNRSGDAAQQLYALRHEPTQRSGRRCVAVVADSHDTLDCSLPLPKRQARAISDFTPGTAHNTRATDR